MFMGTPETNSLIAASMGNHLDLRRRFSGYLFRDPPFVLGTSTSSLLSSASSLVSSSAGARNFGDLRLFALVGIEGAMQWKATLQNRWPTSTYGWEGLVNSLRTTTISPRALGVKKHQKPKHSG